MAVWDTTTPTGSEAVSSGDDRIRELKTAVEDSLRGGAAEGTEAIFPGNAASTSPVFRYRGLKGTTVARPTAGQYGLYFDTTRSTLQRDNGTIWEDIGTNFSSGTVMLFGQATAPTGWTKLVTQNDKALRIVSGSTGGTAGGSLAVSSGLGSYAYGGHAYARHFLNRDRARSQDHQHLQRGNNGPRRGDWRRVWEKRQREWTERGNLRRYGCLGCELHLSTYRRHGILRRRRYGRDRLNDRQHLAGHRLHGRYTGVEGLMNQQPVIQCCSVNGKVCRNGKREDFPTDERTGEKFICNEWVNVRGQHPQTGEVIDNFMCGKYARVMLALEQAQQMRQTAASADKVATEVRRQSRTIYGLASNEARERLLKADGAIQPTVDLNGIEHKENGNGTR
jgi:hypothetical protein